MAPGSKVSGSSGTHVADSSQARVGGTGVFFAGAPVIGVLEPPALGHRREEPPPLR